MSHGVHAVQHEVQHQLEHEQHEKRGDHKGIPVDSNNRRIALLIAVIALFLAFSETLGKNAQTSALTYYIEASNLWNFFQAKTIRRTLVETAAEEMTVHARLTADAAAKTAMDKQVDAWKQTARRYRSEPETREGSTELMARAKEAETKQEIARASYHHYELASAVYQIAIVLASSAVITGMMALAYAAGALGVLGIVFTCIGLFAPHAFHLL